MRPLVPLARDRSPGATLDRTLAAGSRIGRVLFPLPLALRLSLVLVLESCAPSVPTAYQPAPGDVVFQSLPHSPLVDTIEGTTHSPYSHCGIVTKSAGEWVVVEAFHTVHETPLAEWIARGRESAFTVCRWREDRADVVPAVLAALEKYRGRPYDFHYSMDDDSIYCSELIFKAYRDVTGLDLGALVTLGELDWKPYERTIRAMEQGSLPLDRTMITPVAVSRAPELEEVLAYGWSGGWE